MYLFYFLPGVVINLGSGNIPLRYLSLLFLFKTKKIDKLSYLLILSLLFHAFVICVGFLFDRVPSLIDVSYLINYLVVFVSINYVYSNPHGFYKYMYVFTIVNIIYALIQNILLNVNVSSDLLMLHENIKDSSYVIPPSFSFGYLYRYTGLFHESAPFMIFMMFSLLFFIKERKKSMVKIILMTMILSGSKIAILFVFTLLLLYFLSKLKVRISYFFIIPVFFVIINIDTVNDFLLLNVNSSDIGSIYSRFYLLYTMFKEFFLNQYVLFFGEGLLPTSAKMGMNRGLDFFSAFIFGNGLMGSFLILFPLIIYVYFKAKNWEVSNKNILFLALVLSLTTSGSLLIMQYNICFMILAYFTYENKNISTNI